MVRHLRRCWQLAPPFWPAAGSAPSASAAAVAAVAAAAAATLSRSAPSPVSAHNRTHPAPPSSSTAAARHLHLAPPFLVEDYVPALVTTHNLGRTKAKVEQALKELEDCRACPRNCGVNRAINQLGMCNVGRNSRVATIAPHYGEEAPLQGWMGSGTIFFSMCNMRCVFCQNWCEEAPIFRVSGLGIVLQDISHQPKGFELTAQELADWMVKLQDEGGVHNINLVTPEHMVPQIVEALALAAAKGLSLPVVYNTSGYDAVESIRMMEGLVDIYMPDFKFWLPDTAAKYAKARDYPERAREAILEMHKQVGDLVFSPDGLAKRGLLLRHLVMPGQGEEAREILRWVARELGRNTFVNIMPQYHPRHLVGRGEQRSRLGFVTYEEIGQRPQDAEVEELMRFARGQGLWRFEEAPRYELAGQQGDELAA